MRPDGEGRKSQCLQGFRDLQQLKNAETLEYRFCQIRTRSKGFLRANLRNPLDRRCFYSFSPQTVGTNWKGGYIPTLIVFRSRVRSAFLWTYPLTGSALQSDEFYNPNPTVDNDSNTFSHAHQPTGWAWVNPQLMIFDDAVQTDCLTEGAGGH